MPKVSICLPNLNNGAYLPERFETIFNQTLQDWELIVCDNYSDDGAWEFIQEQARKDSRVHISQAPRDGLYANWNNCIRKARGEYVYIATSDDTMSADCLEKFVFALDQNPDCDLAHCCLDFIDEHGGKISTGHCWDNWFTTRFFGDWNHKLHVRPQGHDTVVAMSLKTVYYSITQVLVRRRLFDKVGLFEKRWGSFGDLEWQMRAALATKTLHVPEYLATWRIHPQQASQVERYHNAVRDGWFLEMATDVINFSRARNLPFTGGLPKRLRHFYWDECISARLGNEKKFHRKLGILLKSLSIDPMFIVPFVQSRFLSRIFGTKLDLDHEVRKELNHLGLDTLAPVK